VSIATSLTDFVRKSRIPGVFDTATKTSPLFMDLKKNMKPAGGGAIEFALRYQAHGRTMAWGEFAEAPPMKRDVITTGTLSTIDIAEPVDISNTRLRNINSGANGATLLVNYLNSMTQAAEDSITQHLSGSLFSSGAISANAFGQPLNNLTGLSAIVSNTATYAGVAVADAPGWKSNTITLGTADATGASNLGVILTGSEGLVADLLVASHTTYLQKLLDIVINNCSWNGESPSMIVTDLNGMALIEQLLFPQQRYQQDTAYAGFKAIFYRNIPVFMDRLCPANTIYVLNTKYLELHAVPGAEITFDTFRYRAGTDVMTGMYLFSGNIACTSRRHQGAIFNLPTA
jgi:hypothetical protein